MDIPDVTEFLYHRRDLFFIQNGICIIQDQEYLLLGDEWLECRKINGVVDACTNDLRQALKEKRQGGRELVTADESTVFTKLVAVLIIMEDR